MVSDLCEVLYSFCDVAVALLIVYIVYIVYPAFNMKFTLGRKLLNKRYRDNWKGIQPASEKPNVGHLPHLRAVNRARSHELTASALTNGCEAINTTTFGIIKQRAQSVIFSLRQSEAIGQATWRGC
jgi:hypothetical protein